jgi:protein-disulfide isomerase/uncharacterized membrane protein
MADESASAPSPDTKKSLIVTAMGLSVVGAILAGTLLWEHYSGATLLGCSSTGIINCTSVNSSVFSELHGIPIAAFGLAAYFLIFGVLLTRFNNGPEKGDGSLSYGFLFALAAVGFDVFLLWAQKYVIGSYCLYCIGTYGVNVGIVVLTFLALGSLGRVPASIRKDWSELGAMKPVGYGLLLAIVVAFGVLLFKPVPPGAEHFGPFTPPTGGGFRVPGIATNASKDRAEILAAPFVDPGPGGCYSRGGEKPVLTIVEFGDLECPACRKTSWVVHEFLAKHPSEVRLCFRHYPLDILCNTNVHRPIHEFACATAHAAEAAGQQGKFWDFVDDVYKQNDDSGNFVQKPDLTHTALEARAKKMGLDMKQFDDASGTGPGSADVNSKILDDITMGAQVGVESTPTLFVNGRLISGGRSLETMELWLDMAKKGDLDPKGSKVATPSK